MPGSRPMTHERGRLNRAAFAVLAGALAVSACTARGNRPAAPAPPAESAPAVTVPPPETVASAQHSEAVETAVEPGPAAPVVAEPAVSEEPGPEPAAVAVLKPPARPEIDDDPARLMNLEGAALEALLGPPGFTREEADAQVWQYRGQGCVLDVFLYSAGLAEPYRVTYFEIRADAADEDAKRRCFRNLLLARAAG